MSESGYSVEILGQTGLRYTEGERTMFIDSELLAVPGAIALYQSTIKRWDSPTGSVSIGDEEKRRILENIRAAFESQRYELQVI